MSNLRPFRFCSWPQFVLILIKSKKQFPEI